MSLLTIWKDMEAPAAASWRVALEKGGPNTGFPTWGAAYEWACGAIVRTQKIMEGIQ